MNLKLKTTIVWLKRMSVLVMILLLLLAIVWLLIAYPIVIGFITVGSLIVFVIVDTWLCVYYDLKENKK